VEVVGATAEGERETATENQVREAIAEIFSRMDEDSNHEISRGEFLAMRKDKNVMEALSELEITPPHFHLYTELFFRPLEDGSMPSLSYDQLVSMILRLRPGSFLSALDFAAFAKCIIGIHDRIKERVNRIEDLCQELAMGPDAEITLLSCHGGADWDAMPGSPSSLGDAMPALLNHVGGKNEPASPNHVSAFDGAGQIPLHRRSLNDYDRGRLEHTDSTEIIEALQKRMGMADLDMTGVPFSMLDEELQNRVQKAALEQKEQKEQKELGGEAFKTLGVPQMNVEDEEETVYV